jgi:hypothetical protein
MANGWRYCILLAERLDYGGEIAFAQSQSGSLFQHFPAGCGRGQIERIPLGFRERIRKILTGCPQSVLKFLHSAL